MRTFYFISILLFITNCTQNMNTNETHTNRLIDATSPYLRQHAHNPVDWYPWGEEALNKAKEANKPIILSIGYSSCHWCHVMAHESFENDSIAQYMNEHFINIKLDREERPDIDQIYMDAVQAMGLRGGWPLNVFLTPDQKPFYGGTYFPPQQWMKLLQGIVQAYTENYDKLYESANQFAESLQQSEVGRYGLQNAEARTLSTSDFTQAFDTLASRFDADWGGIKKAPKFPMPSLWEFLAHYHRLSGDEKALNHFLFTLDKIAAGGIFDQVGGGFARYSVDGEWHVPHFEKMLYDNGQLMSIYATGYKLKKDLVYKEVMVKTAEWLEREMLDASGGFYSALDADSDGEEGKFYVWSYQEVKELAGDDLSIVAEYYDVSPGGNWEGKNVLRRLETNETLAKGLDISEEALREKVADFDKKALKYREQRIRPGLDDKIISGWNGLMLKGLCDAYQATGEDVFLALAKKNAAFILEELISGDRLLRIKGLETQGFLEDYGAVIAGLISYYETTFNETYLLKARALTDRVVADFYDEEEGYFFYTADDAEALIARKKELFDNVIPSSNSIMANNLYRLGVMLDHEPYKELAGSMVGKISPLIIQEPEYLSNWALTAMMMLEPTAEVLIVGKGAGAMALDLAKQYLPNKVLMATESSSELPLFAYKEPLNDQTTIFVCYNKACKRPVFTVENALDQLKKLE